MAFVFIFLISAVSLFLTPASSQMDIVSVKTIEDGTPFTITCNAQRVNTQSNISSILSLEVNVSSSGNQDNRRLAQYVSLGPDNSRKETQNMPPGRNWKFSLTGSEYENGGKNNAGTMKIEILVLDATCADAGVYRCIMQYYYDGGLSPLVESLQNVTSTAKTTEPLVVLDPIYDAPSDMTNTSTYDVGANITVTCTFQGPEELGLKWKQEVRPAIGIDIRYEDFPIANQITTDTATREPQTSTVCPQYTHRSVLKLTISKLDHQRRYLCVVMSDNEEKASSAVYIEVSSSEPTSAPDRAAGAGTEPSKIGLIVGLAVGIPIAIIIVVVIIIVFCRRRSKGSDKNKHETDHPDGLHQPYVPPPVSYSRPNKPVNNNNNKEEDMKALDDDGRSELRNRQHDDVNYTGKEGKSYRYNPSYDNDAYTHKHKQTNGLSQHNKDDLHYASTDVSRSEDESVEQPVMPPSRNTSQPKPRNPPPVPRKREDNKALNYIQLDLPPSKKESSENAGNRKRTTSVEYAEITV